MSNISVPKATFFLTHPQSSSFLPPVLVLRCHWPHSKKTGGNCSKQGPHIENVKKFRISFFRMLENAFPDAYLSFSVVCLKGHSPFSGKVRGHGPPVSPGYMGPDKMDGALSTVA